MPRKPTYICPICKEAVFKNRTIEISLQFTERDGTVKINRHIRSHPVCNRSYCSWMMWNRLCDKYNLQHMKRSAESIAEVKPANLP